MAEWLTVGLRTKWLWVRVPLPSLEIKLFSLCEDSGYICNYLFILAKLHAGDDEQRALENRIRKSDLIVSNLANNLLGLGYKTTGT